MNVKLSIREHTFWGGKSESDASTSLDRLVASIPAQIKSNWFWILAYSFNFIYFVVALIRANLGDAQESTKHSIAAKPDKQLNNQTTKDAPSTYPQSIGAWVINIGDYVNKCSSNHPDSYGKAITCEVSEGLLAPLYFIILALMGGSISLTRRLPELQKQAGAEHIATEKQPKLTQYEFREYLIFQMVQFISAPFLAILAYYLIEPSNTTNAVALAFTAGFA